MGDIVESTIESVNFGTHEVKIIDRSIINLSGIKKIISFNKEEFLLESVMGIIDIKGNNLELIKLDTHDGNVKIKGKISSFQYIEANKKNKEESLLVKLFK